MDEEEEETLVSPTTRYHLSRPARVRPFDDSGRKDSSYSSYSGPKSAPAIIITTIPTTITTALQRTVTHVPPPLPNDPKHTTIVSLLAAQPSSRVAFRSPLNTTKPATYGNLLNLVTRNAAVLPRYDIARNSTVVTILPDGPLAAAAFLCVASHAAAAPLNPSAPHAELVDAVAQLFPKAVLTSKELWPTVAPVVEEVNRLALEATTSTNTNNNTAAFSFCTVDLLVVEDTSVQKFSGAFEFVTTPCHGQHSHTHTHGTPSDLALILRTSGSTSRPKVVPLTLSSIVRNGCAIASALRLTADDVAINAMPLFHVGGISASVLATLAAGASVILMSGFKPAEFANALVAGSPITRPTWYSAVPTIHLALMQYVQGSQPDIVANHRLRFIRSGAASLSVESAQQLREFWNVPVVPSYSMTEQMPISQCPVEYDFATHPGTVGLPIVNVKIVDDNGTALPRSDAYPIIGEICISSPDVMKGYVDNDDANREAFFTSKRNDTYFRTGDLGYVDSDGFLYLAGRKKELIKVGGEQVSPFEVEEALHRHPAVHIALTCGIPNDLLGEVVGAVVVLSPSTAGDCDHREILASIKQHCVNEGLPPFKVPRLAVAREEELPRGPTRKFLRNKLAETFFSTAREAADAKTQPPSDSKNAAGGAKVSDATLGIRFILALIVCLNHIGDHAWPHEGRSVNDHDRWSAAVTSMRVVGDLGTVMFGMLAGFSLCVSMTQAVQRGRELRFYESRLVPISLIYLIATALCVFNRLFFCTPDKFGPYDYGSENACRSTVIGLGYGGTWLTSLIVNILQLQAWPIGLGVWHISYYTWFSSAYAFCIVCYPYLERLFVGREKPGKLVWTHVWLQVIHLATLVLMEAVYLSRKADTEWVNYWVWGGYMFPPFWAVRFACGMFLGLQFREYRPHEKVSAWIWGVVTDTITLVCLVAYVLMIHFGMDLHVRFSRESYLEDRMYSGVTPRLAVPIFMVYIYGLAVGRGMTCALLSSRWIVKLSPASYAIYLLHQPVFEWWSVLTTGEWWTQRKPFEWFSPDPIPLDWWATAVVILLTVHFSVAMTWLVDEILMQRWLSFVRACKKFVIGEVTGGDAASKDDDAARELVLDAIEDLVGVRATMDDRPAELLASLGIVAMGAALQSRATSSMRRLTPVELVGCETVADLINLVTEVMHGSDEGADVECGGHGILEGTAKGDPSPYSVMLDFVSWIRSFYVVLEIDYDDNAI